MGIKEQAENTHTQQWWNLHRDEDFEQWYTMES